MLTKKNDYGKTVFLLFGIVLFYSCKHTTKLKQTTAKKETVNSVRNYIYADNTGMRVLIHNSFPKGEGYIAPDGKQYFKVIFWTEITNETDIPLDFKIDFGEDFDEFSKLPGNYYKILIAKDTMATDKETMINFGFKGVNSFLDNNIDKPTSLKRTIHPKTSSGFYIIFLRHSTNIESVGVLRTGFHLEGQDLIYKVSRYANNAESSSISEKEIICGNISLKNLMQIK